MFDMVEVNFNNLNENKSRESALTFHKEISDDQVEKMVKLVTEFQKADVLNSLNFSYEHIFEYLNRGGKIELVETDTRVKINNQDTIITGCNEGRCRSQATAGFLRKNGIRVEHVIAGRASAINFFKENPNLRNPVVSELDEYAFEQVFNCRKLPQVGHHLGQEQLTILDQARAYYANFIHALTNQTHFIVFGMSGPVVLLHLLNRSGSLEGFKITYFNWIDSITHCQEKHSVTAYQNFVEQLKRHLIL